MKHVKDIILERRNFKPYLKYVESINKTFEKYAKLELEKTSVCKEYDEIIVSFKIWYNVDKNFITKCLNKFGDVDYKIFPASGYQSVIEFYNIPKFVLDEIETEIESKKYNI